MNDHYDHAVEVATQFLKPLITNGRLADHSVEPSEYIYLFGLPIVQEVDGNADCSTVYRYPEHALRLLCVCSQTDKGAFDLLSRIVSTRLIRNDELGPEERIFAGHVLVGLMKPPPPEGKKLAKSFGQNVILIYLSYLLHREFGVSLTRNDEAKENRSVCDAVSKALQLNGVQKSPRAIKDLLTHRSSARAREIVDQVMQFKVEQRLALEDQKTDP